MDPTLIAAAIGAASTLIVGALAAWSQIISSRATQRREQLEEAVGKLSSGPDNFLGALAAFRVAEVERLVEIRDDGSGSERKTWRDIKVSQVFEDLQIPIRTRIVSDGVHVLPPRVKELPGSSFPVSLRHLHLVDVVAGRQQTVEASVVVHGHLTPESEGAGYIIEQEVHNPVALTREAAQRAYRDAEWKLEYVAQYITVPIERLLLQVKLPKSHRGVRLSAVAFVGPTEVVHDSESRRASMALTITGDGAALHLSAPVIGITYAITWLPPSQSSGGAAETSRS